MSPNHVLGISPEHSDLLGGQDGTAPILQVTETRGSEGTRDLGVTRLEGSRYDLSPASPPLPSPHFLPRLL